MTFTHPLPQKSKNKIRSSFAFSEKPVLDNGGCVMRFGGLYTSYRGAHNYWIGKDSVPSSPDGLINLLHYEDAAGAVIRDAIQWCRENRPIEVVILLFLTLTLYHV